MRPFFPQLNLGANQMSHERKVLQKWDINEAMDLADAITEADEIVSAEGDDTHLSFVLMTEKDENVSFVELVKIDLTDSFAYEIVLS